jgi:hypothetical protein
MPTYERRYFLGLLTKDAKEREEYIEEMRNNSSGTSGGSGTRTKKISGDALKTNIKNGTVPYK